MYWLSRRGDARLGSVVGRTASQWPLIVGSNIGRASVWTDVARRVVCISSYAINTSKMHDKSMYPHCCMVMNMHSRSKDER